MNRYNLQYIESDRTARTLAEFAARDLSHTPWGFSISLQTWVTPSKGYLVGGYSWECNLVPAEFFMPAALETGISYALRNLAYQVHLRTIPRRLPFSRLYIGGWRETETSPMTIEISRVWYSLDAAYHDGMVRSQKAIYDALHRHTITLPARGW